MADSSVSMDWWLHRISLPILVVIAGFRGDLSDVALSH
jgi:hypothetical protein